MLFFMLIPFLFYSQNEKKNILIEDNTGKIIKDVSKQKEILARSRNQQLTMLPKVMKVESSNINVDLCSNGGFEDYENISGVKYLKYYDFQSVIDYPSPSECQLPTLGEGTAYRINSINQFLVPKYFFDAEVLTTTVPSNFIDPYLGNIKSFGQYALKINRMGNNQDPFACIVSAKRKKTNSSFKFNYKVVMQTIMNDYHKNNQPFFKVRLSDKYGNLKGEFCLVADTENCIFKKKKENNADVYTLYTPEWREGYLDLSSIADNEEFTIEFITARCGMRGHFSYVYIDNICLEENLIN